MKIRWLGKGCVWVTVVTQVGRTSSSDGKPVCSSLRVSRAVLRPFRHLLLAVHDAPLTVKSCFATRTRRCSQIVTEDVLVQMPTLECLLWGLLELALRARINELLRSAECHMRTHNGFGSRYSPP